MAWRTTDAQQASAPAGAGCSPPKAAGGAGSFFAAMGSDRDGGNFSMPGFGSDTGTDVVGLPLAPVSETGQAARPASGGERTSCYECYKQVYAKFALECQDPKVHVARKFCSEGCVGAFEEGLRRKEALQAQREMQQEKARVLAEVKGMGGSQAAGESTGGAGSGMCGAAAAAPGTEDQTVEPMATTPGMRSASLFAVAAAMPPN